MKYYKIGLLVTGLFLFSACFFMGERVEGNGNMVKESRDAGPASKIKSTSNIEVWVQQGSPAIMVECDENLLPYLITEKEDGWLKIYWKDDINVDSKNAIKVTVTSPTFSAFAVTGSGSINAVEKINCDGPVELKATGSGGIDLFINTPEITAHITGSGNVQLTGECRDEDITVTGSGQYNGENLKAENVNATVTGSGDITVYASETLIAKITGSGSVRYAGNATVETKISGSGQIRKIE